MRKWWTAYFGYVQRSHLEDALPTYGLLTAWRTSRMKRTFLTCSGTFPQTLQQTLCNIKTWGSFSFPLQSEKKPTGSDSSALFSIIPEILHNLKRKVLIYSCSTNGKLWNNTPKRKVPCVVMDHSWLAHYFCGFGQRYRTLATSQENIRSGETVYKKNSQCSSNVSSTWMTREDKNCHRFHETWETWQLNARWDTGLDSGQKRSQLKRW